MPLTSSQRALNYYVQNNRTGKKTPKQLRRLRKKANYWSKRDQSQFVKE